MGQANKVCPVCLEMGHSKFYCKKRVQKPIKRTAIKRVSPAIQKAKRVSKKKNTETRGKLVKKLDDVFSRYIRYSAVESDGMVQCVTCPTRLPPQNMQNGHFISRGKYPTRWHEDNCHPQCMRDNVFLKGAYIEYTMYMIDTYGRDHVEELRTLAKSGVKVSTSWIKEQIVKYDSLVKDMLQ